MAGRHSAKLERHALLRIRTLQVFCRGVLSRRLSRVASLAARRYCSTFGDFVAYVTAAVSKANGGDPVLEEESVM